MFRPTQTSHALTHDHSGVKSFLPLPTAPRDRRKEHPGVSRGVRLRALERSRPRHPAMTLWKKKKKKQFQEGETGLRPRHAALPAHQNRFLGGTRWPFRGMTAWCRGHVHRLAHGVGNYAETQGWPEAMYSAQHYWSELLTDIQSALKSLFTGQIVLSVLLSPPTPCSPFHAAAQTFIYEWIWDETDSKYYTKHTMSIPISPDRWSWFKETTQYNTTHTDTSPRILHSVLKKANVQEECSYSGRYYMFSVCFSVSFQCFGTNKTVNLFYVCIIKPYRSTLLWSLFSSETSYCEFFLFFLFFSKCGVKNVGVCACRLQHNMASRSMLYR